ncbi:MFS transporter [Dasania marina]|uniref:MFS transporter n=1 Tax=Dasania marina TaxID=471499 RepID=UPI0030D7F38F|tara:strand:- start:33987 stop:35186 length:1200 start_codon:yes stop_codon:yes gene_type:complete
MNHSAVQTSKVPLLKRLPIASANGEIARVLLSFLATAGLFYVNIMPALIDGLIDGLGFSNRDAGFVGSANVYGAALGALTAVFIVKRINWKKTALLLLLGLLVTDLFSIYLTTVNSLVLTRFLHGCIGGMLVGIAFAVIARTSQADRTFGYLLTVQFGLGGAGLMFLPPLVPEYGTAALFIALMAFSAVTLCMLPFLADYKIIEPLPADKAIAVKKINYPLLALALLATFLFQAANMGVYAYVIGLGKAAGQDMLFISSTLGFAAWIAIAGSVLVIVMSTRFGRLWPILIATLLTIVGTWLFHYSESKSYYWVANVGVGITWAFVISYLLGMCAEFDSSGQMAALGGFASKMGLASGPLTAALIVGDNNYGLLVNVALVALLLCMAAVILPTLALDKAK